MLIIRLRGRLRLADLASEIGVSIEELLAEFKTILQESYQTFGIRAFSLEYDGRREWSIISSSCVGYLVGDNVLLVLESKLPNLSVQKLLAMAQEVGGELYKITSPQIGASLIETSGFNISDVLAISLIDSCSEVRRAGRDFRYEPQRVQSFNLKGTIDFEETLQSGTTRPPVSSVDVMVFDTPVNRLLVAALDKVKRTTGSNRVLELVCAELDLWTDASEPWQRWDEDFDLYALRLAYPRRDYERAAQLALAVLLELEILMAGGEVTASSVLVDVDALFEKFCSHYLRIMLSESVYRVDLQPVFDHPANPVIAGSIKPDLVIKRNGTSQTFVVDLKNKYSQLEEGRPSALSNPDVFQVSYYALALGSRCAFLVYPSTTDTLRFPIKKSESQAKYAERVEKFCEQRKSLEPEIQLGDNKVRLIPYQIELGGSGRETLESIASLAMYMDFLSGLDHREDSVVV